MKKYILATILSISALHAFADAVEINDELISDTRKGSFNVKTKEPLEGDYIIKDYRHTLTHQHYTKGLRNGPFKVYDYNGELSHEGEFTNGVMSGIWKSYIDGKIFTEERYVNGEAEGTRIEYHRNGKPKFISTHLHSKMEGPVESYYEDGKLEYRHTIRNGKEEGLYESYHPNGQLRFKYIAVNGKHPDGEFTSYHPDGSTYLTENYKNGELNGESKCYYENHNLRCHEFYKDGKYDGTIKAYRENGTLGSSIEYKNGKGNGKASFYDKKGELYCTAVYKDDYQVGAATKYVDKKPVKAENCN